MRFLTLLLLLTTPLLADVTNNNNGELTEALLKQISKGFSTVAKKATPAVVYIESQAEQKQSPRIEQRKPRSDNPFDYFNDDFFNNFFGYPNRPKKSEPQEKTVRGSGFIVSKDGFIVTNNHVVENAAKVTVTFNSGKKYSATVIGTDPKTDLAVIKIEGDDFPYLSFANSEELEVGDWAIAIGNPFGLQATVTVGVVSAKGRSQLHIADFEDFIQTDAAINPGNSGGPLLDVEGEVIGVNTAIVSGSGGYMGIGFAIPSNMAKQIINQLIDNGEVTRGFLGVTLQPIDEDLADIYGLKSTHGALVTDVIPDSPAAKGGLQQEDIIIGYNGSKVENISAFRNYVALLTPGSKLKLRVMRDGKEKGLNVVISTAPGEVSGPNSPVQRLGLSVQELSADLAQKYDLTETKGVVIARVEPGSPAAEAQLRAGSLIIAVNRKKVSSLEEFSLAVQQSQEEGRVLLMVRQGSAVRFVALHFD